MADTIFRNGVLAVIQQVVMTDLLPEISSPKNRDTAVAVARLLGRLRVEFESAPALAAQRLDEWRQIARASGAQQVSADGSEPVQAFAAATAAVAAAIQSKRADAAFYRDLANPVSSTAAWFKRAVTATRDYADACEAAIPKVKPATGSPLSNPEELRRKLGDYLVSRYPQLPQNPVRSLKIIPGGRSKETSLFELAPNNVLPTRLVLRRDCSQEITGTAVFGEYSLLKAMDELGLPVPKPILGEKDPSHLGGGFIIVTEVLDSARVGDFFPELNDMTKLHSSFAPDLARAMARLHRLTKFPEGADLGGHHASTDPVGMVKNFQALWDSLNNKPPMAVATELGLAWLLSHPPANRPSRVVHGDVGTHNLMVRDGRLTAILDWELAHVGDPAEDIGYMRAMILRPLIPWDEFVKTYVAEGGDREACDTHAVNWYSVWSVTRNSIYVGILYDMACKGQRSDIDSYYPAVDFVARTQQYIARELEIALA